MLSRSEESRYSCLAPKNKQKAFGLSLLSIISAISLLQMFYINLKFSYIPRFLLRFCQECWIFSNALCCIYWDDHIVFLFCYVNIMKFIDWFSNAKPILHWWDEPIWSWCSIFLYSVDLHLLKFCLYYLHLCSWKISVCRFFFLMPSHGTHSRIMFISQDKLGTVCPLQFCGKECIELVLFLP